MTHADVRALLAADPNAAVAAARELVAERPDDAAARLLLGRSLRATGHDKEASEEERAAVALARRSPRHRAAARDLQNGRTFEATRTLRALLDEDPDDAAAAIWLGIHASRAGDMATADRLLAHAAALVPGEPGAQLALAEHLVRSKRFAPALAALDSLPDRDRADASAERLRATCLGELGRVEEQLAAYHRLSAASPDPGRYALPIALAQRALGQLDEAERGLRAVLARAPGDGLAWYHLANLKRGRFDDRDVRLMEGALAEEPSPDRRIPLHFALGTALEQRGDAAGAFAQYAAGNALKADTASYDPAAIGTWVDRSIAAFTAEFFAARAGQGDPARDPIFVVGMQRSGSTLVEQMLASHPAIEGTAELPELPRLVREIGTAATAAGQPYEQRLASLDADALQALGADYIAATRLYRQTGRPMFIDKMPNNWMHVSLIRLILPNATIIDVRRDPMDCAFSNWKQLYARGLDHSNRLDTMGLYYRDYVRLMRHLDSVQPGAVHRVIYEDLVADPEGTARRILDRLGLPFDPAVLDFHRTERAVRTISAGQVRQPINRKGIGAWRAFEPWLAPLADALGDTCDHWRD